jgi:hypothetical protein
VRGRINGHDRLCCRHRGQGRRREADSDSDAERLARDRVFRDDLMVLTTGGLPLWDGVSDIEIRHARPGEAAKWRASRARAISQGNIEGAEEAWIAFLVALTDPHRRGR